MPGQRSANHAAVLKKSLLSKLSEKHCGLQSREPFGTRLLDNLQMLWPDHGCNWHSLPLYPRSVQASPVKVSSQGTQPATECGCQNRQVCLWYCIGRIGNGAIAMSVPGGSLVQHPDRICNPRSWGDHRSLLSTGVSSISANDRREAKPFVPVPAAPETAVCQ